MENKYLNEAIIGNKNMIATLTEKGELQRLYFPNKDNRQYINFYHTGVTVNQCDLIYLHDDINNVYKQYYDTDTNILNTEITNTYFNLKILHSLKAGNFLWVLFLYYIKFMIPFICGYFKIFYQNYSYFIVFYQHF